MFEFISALLSPHRSVSGFSRVHSKTEGLLCELVDFSFVSDPNQNIDMSHNMVLCEINKK